MVAKRKPAQERAIQVYDLSKDERARIGRLAHKLGRSLSRWIADAARMRLDREAPRTDTSAWPAAT